MGDGTDFQLYHASSDNNSYIVESGAGSLVVNASKLHVKNAANNEDVAVFNQSGNNELYFSNSKKFETTNTGAVVTGILTATSFSGGLPIPNEGNDRIITSSGSGAVNAEQMLSLLQDKLKRNDNGDVVVLNGGVEQDLGTYIGNLKNPGSGWEHHFKPSSAAGMGAKPTPTSNVSPGMLNPWKEGSINLTRQMILESSEPDLAAVLKKEAGAST